MKYLKIKDNIDLKELEKFGFRAITIVDKIKYQFIEIISGKEIYNIKIDEKGILHLNQLAKYNTIPGVIYDLIKADMVEVKHGSMYKISK